MEIDQQLTGLLGQGGIAAALLFLLWKVGTKMVGAVDKLTDKIDRHTQDENEHHTMVREEIAALRGHFGVATPAHGSPVRPTPLSVVPRGQTNGDGDK